MTRHHHYDAFRTALDDRSRLLALVEGADDATTCECSSCLGEGGFAVYPSEHSHRTVWEQCVECAGEGRVPL